MSMVLQPLSGFAYSCTVIMHVLSSPYCWRCSVISCFFHEVVLLWGPPTLYWRYFTLSWSCTHVRNANTLYVAYLRKIYLFLFCFFFAKKVLCFTVSQCTDELDLSIFVWESLLWVCSRLHSPCIVWEREFPQTRKQAILKIHPNDYIWFCNETIQMDFAIYSYCCRVHSDTVLQDDLCRPTCLFCRLADKELSNNCRIWEQIPECATAIKSIVGGKNILVIGWKRAEAEDVIKRIQLPSRSSLEHWWTSMATVISETLTLWA